MSCIVSSKYNHLWLWLSLYFLSIISRAFIIKWPVSGGDGGVAWSVLDQGRISGITSWGINAGHNGVVIKNWTSDDQSSSHTVFGTHPIDSAICTPFTLNDTEYINGYKLIYGKNTWIISIRYIGFHASNGNKYECSIDSNHFSDGTITEITDTNWIILSGVYLTGFFLYDYEVIDSISFQFKSFNNLTIVTDVYGGDGGNNMKQIFDQQRISGILEWGYSSSNFGVIIAEWSSDINITNSDKTFGSKQSIDTQCTPFTITDGQYIDGYRVKYNTSIYYIAFHISDGSIYECNSGYSSSLYDSGMVIISPTSFLSGFWVKYDSIIHQIGFQFTHHSLFPTDSPTNIPTVSPTNIPTVSPTNIPTDSPTNIPTVSPTNIPTDSPTNIPTVYPTFEPTKDPTIHPTHYPTFEPTFIPSMEPTSTPTANPSSNPTQTKTPTNRPTESIYNDDEIETTISTPIQNTIDKPDTKNDYLVIFLLILALTLCVIVMILLLCYFKLTKKEKKTMKTNVINVEMVDAEIVNKNEHQYNNKSSANQQKTKVNHFNSEELYQNARINKFNSEGMDQNTKGGYVSDNGGQSNVNSVQFMEEQLNNDSDESSYDDELQTVGSTIRITVLGGHQV